MDGVIGIDEVGRGSWAGPLLIVAAKAGAALPDGLTDSKLLTRSRREAFAEVIKQTCRIGEGWVQPDEIDKLGLGRAMRLGVARALMAIGAAPADKIIIDGLVNYCPEEFTAVQAVVKADNAHAIVSAASIYAKVARDRHMRRLAGLYPYYGFERHAGYGTRLHKELLKIHGPSKIHRFSYKPIKALAR